MKNRIAILLAVWAGLAALLTIHLLGRHTPYVFVDEAFFGKLGMNLGNGEGFTYQGQGTSFRTIYPYLIAPAWLFFKGETAYHVALALNAAAMTSVVFPTYALARRVASFPWAVAAGALAALTPSIIWAGMLMTEPLAYPAAGLAALAMVNAVARPGWRSLALVAGAILLATLVRSQLAVLGPAFIAAVVIDVARHGRGAKERALEHRYTLIASGAAIALGSLLFAVGRGDVILGAYERLLDKTPGAHDLFQTSVQYIGVMAIGVAIAPMIAFLALAGRPKSWSDPDLGPLLAVSLTVIIAMVVAAAWTTTTVSPELRERYVFYAAPLLAASAAALIRHGRWPFVLGASALAAAYMRPFWADWRGVTVEWRDYDFDTLRDVLVGNKSYAEIGFVQFFLERPIGRLILLFAGALVAAYLLRNRIQTTRARLIAAAAVIVVPLVWLKLGPLRSLRPYDLLSDLDHSQLQITLVATIAAGLLMTLGVALKDRAFAPVLVLIPAMAFGFLWAAARGTEANRISDTQEQLHATPVDWIDRAADGPVAILRTRETDYFAIWHWEVWNEDVERVYRLDTVTAQNGFGEECVIEQISDGVLEPIEPCAGGEAPRYLVLSNPDVPLAIKDAELVHADEHDNARLYRIEPGRKIRIGAEKG